MSPTEAGEVLLREIAPNFDSIAKKLDDLSALREKPFGHIRICELFLGKFQKGFWANASSSSGAEGWKRRARN